MADAADPLDRYDSPCGHDAAAGEDSDTTAGEDSDAATGDDAAGDASPDDGRIRPLGSGHAGSDPRLDPDSSPTTSPDRRHFRTSRCTETSVPLPTARAPASRPTITVVSGGELILRGYKDPAAVAANGCSGDTNQLVTGGVKVTTNSQTYGKYEVRMRVDNGQGYSLVASLWPTSDTWPPEIDFTEDSGGSPRTTDAATEHWGVGDEPLPAHQRPDRQPHPVAHGRCRVDSGKDRLHHGRCAVGHRGQCQRLQRAHAGSRLQIQAWQCGASSWEQCANSSTPAEVDMDVDWIAVYSPAS